MYTQRVCSTTMCACARRPCLRVSIFRVCVCPLFLFFRLIPNINRLMGIGILVCACGGEVAKKRKEKKASYSRRPVSLAVKASAVGASTAHCGRLFQSLIVLGRTLLKHVESRINTKILTFAVQWHTVSRFKTRNWLLLWLLFKETLIQVWTF